MKERRRILERKATAMSFVVALQAVAALFFITDVLEDAATTELDSHLAIESLAATALVVAVVIGAFQIKSLIIAARQDEMAVALAKGAAANLIQIRFIEWKLTKAEADVALFALKGCDVHQIAMFRSSAEGTVRAHLTRVYAKAGVNSQSSLIASFLDELIDPAILEQHSEPREAASVFSLIWRVSMVG